ncbi:MAG TPA: hypothetical protein VGO80_16795 [Solirubrobacteraceae bacterium]|nr:hypothetical protein [Solirubrobacteraceae bacterium]
MLVLATGLGLGAPSPADARARLSACNDNIDNDGDGKIDNFDPGCINGADNNETDLAARPQCSDEKDNETPVPDGKIDFPADPGCAFAGNGNENDPPPARTPQCANGIDDDHNGTADFAGVPTAVPPLPPDPNCIWAADTVEAPTACSDGIDNETPVGDGKIDWPADLGCGGPNDLSEINPPQCNDGRDNDGDGTLDFDTVAGQTRDSDCTSLQDNLEGPHPVPPPLVARCADGVDNDADGKTDFPADPGCTSAADDDETDPPLGLPIIVLPPCADGRDNDRDGKTDFPADPGCTSAFDNDETDVALGPSSTETKVLTPFPVVRLRGRVFPSSVLITLLTVSAPRASRVTTYCKGASCPRKRVAIVAGRQTVRVRKLERRLRAGTVLRIYVTKPGYIGKFTRFTIVKGRAPVRVDRCARKAGSSPRNCPAS